MIYFYEDKEEIIKWLLATLKLTVAGVDISDIKYEPLANGDELAVIIYDNGFRRPVNISCDSGIALMRDILRAIE